MPQRSETEYKLSTFLDVITGKVGSYDKRTTRTSVVEAAQMLHEQTTGSSDCLEDDKVENLRRFVTGRLEHWVFSGARTHQYDEAIRAVLVASLLEFERYKEERSEMEAKSIARSRGGPQ